MPLLQELHEGGRRSTGIREHDARDIVQGRVAKQPVARDHQVAARRGMKAMSREGSPRQFIDRKGQLRAVTYDALGRVKLAVTVNGFQLLVRGAMVDGITRLGTAFIP